jgi:Zn-finger protein
MYDEDGDEVCCAFCGGPLDPATAEQVHDNSDEDGGLVWVCGACVALVGDAWSDDPQPTNEIPF